MLRLTRSDWKFDWAFAWQHLRLGLPMAVQFLIISMGILILQSVCNTFGPETIAGFVSATKIEQLALQPMISFGIAMAVYSAQNYGAGKFDRIRMGVRQCSLVSLAFCAAAAVAMYFYGRNVIALFTTVHDDILMEQALLYLKMSVPFYIFGTNLCLPQCPSGYGHFQRSPHQQPIRTQRPQRVGLGIGFDVGLLRHLLCQPDLLGHGGLVYGRLLLLGHALYEE